MIKKKRQWIVFGWLSFIIFLIKERKQEKGHRIKAAKAKKIFMNLHGIHNSMDTGDIIDFLRDIHMNYGGIPMEGNMILWFIEIIENFNRRPDIVRYIDSLAEMLNWPELRINPNFNRRVFTALIEIIEAHTTDSSIRFLKQRRGCLNQARIGAPSDSSLAADICYERNRISLAIVRYESIPADEWS